MSQLKGANSSSTSGSIEMRLSSAETASSSSCRGTVFRNAVMTANGWSSFSATRFSAPRASREVLNNAVITDNERHSCTRWPRQQKRRARPRVCAGKRGFTNSAKHGSHSLKHPACHPPGGAIEGDRPFVQARACVGRMNFQATKLTFAASPMEFVFLIAMEQVIHRRSVLECCLYRQAHHHKPDTVPAVAGIKSRLVKIKRRAKSEAVYGSSRPLIQEKEAQSHPRALGGELYEFPMKLNDRWRAEGFGISSRIPPLSMQLHENVQSTENPISGVDAVETDIEILF